MRRIRQENKVSIKALEIANLTPKWAKKSVRTGCRWRWWRLTEASFSVVYRVSQASDPIMSLQLFKWRATVETAAVVHPSMQLIITIAGWTVSVSKDKKILHVGVVYRIVQACGSLAFQPSVIQLKGHRRNSSCCSPFYATINNFGIAVLFKPKSLLQQLDGEGSVGFGDNWRWWWLTMARRTVLLLFPMHVNSKCVLCTYRAWPALGYSIEVLRS